MLVSSVLAVLAALSATHAVHGDPLRCSELEPATPADDPGYVLHEWGTFTTIAGSDGMLLEGLTYDDHQLPDFVRQRARSPEGYAGVRCKMETPVIYFYSDRAREISVKVGFQRGILTQWYPDVHELSPPVGPGAEALGGGVLDWGRIRVLAPGDGLGGLPPVGRAVHWEHARAVDANVIARCAACDPRQQHERFLFYRGLGSFGLRLFPWVDPDGRLNLTNRGDEPLAGLIVLARDGRSLRAKRLGALGRERPVCVTQAELQPIELGALMTLTRRLLEEQGLYPKEAEAMVNTWRESYFETDGLRVLYPLPRTEVDWLLPLAVSPPPRESVRVLIGRIDLLTPAAEQAALAALPRIHSADEAHAQLGRFALPLVRRLAALADHARERDHALELARLLEQSF